MGEILKSELQYLAEEFPAYVTNPRGIGLFAAFDLSSKTERDKVIIGLFLCKIHLIQDHLGQFFFRERAQLPLKNFGVSPAKIHKSRGYLICWLIPNIIKNYHVPLLVSNLVHGYAN